MISPLQKKKQKTVLVAGIEFCLVPKQSTFGVHRPNKRVLTKRELGILSHQWWRCDGVSWHQYRRSHQTASHPE